MRLQLLMQLPHGAVVLVERAARAERASRFVAAELGEAERSFVARRPTEPWAVGERSELLLILVGRSKKEAQLVASSLRPMPGLCPSHSASFR